MPLLTDELGILGQQVHHAHRNAIDAEMAARGLKEVNHPMLLTILESQLADSCPQAQRDLAQLLHISPPAVANSLKSLERSGYVRREPDPEDARRNQVALTDKGRQAVEGCHQVFDAVARRMLDGFTPEEQAQLLVFRKRMLYNLRKSQCTSSQEKEDV